MTRGFARIALVGLAVFSSLGTVPSRAAGTHQGSVLTGTNFDGSMISSDTCQQIDTIGQPAITKDSAIAFSQDKVVDVRSTTKRLTLTGTFPPAPTDISATFAFFDANCHGLGAGISFIKLPASTSTTRTGSVSVVVPPTAQWIRVAGNFPGYAQLSWKLA